VHVQKGVTTHGFALNVDCDLQPFEWVVPCGLDGVRMTSVTKELGRRATVAEVRDAVARQVTAALAADRAAACRGALHRS
jgi:lipoyl(octanoyl) transferase